MDIEIETGRNGSLFNGQAAEAIDQFRHEVADDVAGQAMADWHTNLDQSIRRPTPYYETQITVDRAGYDRIVNDRDVIYGPWLEGVGSRNTTTRFKGYTSLRRARASVQARVVQLAAPAVAHLMARLGG